MRVLLGFAPFRHTMVYPDTLGKGSVFARKNFGRLGGVNPPLGILTLATKLKQAGHDTRAVVGFFETDESFLAKARRFDPHVVGFQTTYFSWPTVREFIRKIKAALPETRILIGGPYATYIGTEPLEQCEEIDASFQGEAEDWIVPLCEALAEGRDLSSIPGLIWRRDGGITMNSEPVIVEDLDTTPYPAYELVDIHKFVPAIGSFKKLPSVNIMTSRGCEKKCKFCISRDDVRWRSVEHTMGEIRHSVIKHGARHLIFFDENFTADKERAIEVARRIRAEKIEVNFAINSRVDTADLEVFQALKKAGCWRALFGFESGVQKNLDYLEKDQTLEQSRRAVRLAKEAGIEVKAMFVLGIPDETYEEAIETIDFAISLNPHMASFTNFTPLPGAPVWDEAHEMGTMMVAGALHLINFVPHTMTRDQLVELNRIAFRRFYRRPSYILRRLLRIRSIHDFQRNLRGLQAFIPVRGPGRHRLPDPIAERVNQQLQTSPDQDAYRQCQGDG